MKKNNVVYLANKDIGFECFEILLNVSELYSVNIIGVLTQDKASITGKNASISELAKKNDIPVYSLQELLSIKNIDYLLSVQYHQILSSQHIRLARKLAVNLHMAPLPEYRGCNQFSFAILDDAQEFGTTFHVMNEGIDSGDILFEKRFVIPQNIWVQDLYQLTYQATIEKKKKKIGDILLGNYKPIPQQSMLDKRNTSFHMRNEIEHIKCIDLSWPKEKILKHYRATYFPPFPGPYAIIHGQKTILTEDWIHKNIL